MNQSDAQPFQMTGRQQLVYRSLTDKSELVALLYECSLRVLADGSNPGRVLLAAHSIREMMGGLPKVLELPVLADQGRLGDQMNALEPIWNGAKKSKSHQEGEWAGQIDGPLQNLLKGLHKFFQWWKESRPRRRDVAAQLFRQTDPARKGRRACPLPKLSWRRCKAWPPKRLLAIWSSLPGVQPIRRFKDYKAAAPRIWERIQGLAEPAPPPAQPAQPHAARRAKGGARVAQGAPVNGKAPVNAFCPPADGIGARPRTTSSVGF